MNARQILPLTACCLMLLATSALAVRESASFRARRWESRQSVILKVTTT